MDASAPLRFCAVAWRPQLQNGVADGIPRTQASRQCLIHPVLLRAVCSLAESCKQLAQRFFMGPVAAHPLTLPKVEGWSGRLTLTLRGCSVLAFLFEDAYSSKSSRTFQRPPLKHRDQRPRHAQGIVQAAPVGASNLGL